MKRAAVAIAVSVIASGARLPTAWAQPSAPDVARAVALFDDAKAKLGAGQVDAACRLFVESYRIDPQIGTLLNSALCHERAGKTASAWAEFTTVVSLSSRAGQTKRAEFAREHARQLEPKLTRVRVEVEDTSADLAITIDDEPVRVEALRTGPVPLDPGEHHVRASAKTKVAWEGSWSVSAGATTSSFVIPVLADAPAPPPVVARDVPKTEPARSRPSRTLAYATGGAGVIALGVGAVAGLLAVSAKSDADEGCSGTVCRTPAAFDANERAHTWASVSTVGFVTAGALAVTTVVLLLVNPSSPTPRRAAFAF